MAKILILANNDIGLYKFRKELIEELIKDNEVFISLPNGQYVKKLVEYGCKFIETEIDRRGKNPITDLKLLLKYRDILKDIRPDIVLSYTIKPNIYGGMMCSWLNIPYISNITGLGTAVEKESFLQKLTLALYKLALRDAYCVFFQNEENANFIKSKGIINGKSRIIPGSGVNTDYYKELEYPQDKSVNFLFISRVMKEKGIDQYLDAAQYIKKKYSNTNFHILGFCEDSYEKRLEAMQDEGIIKYHGMQDDTRVFLKKSHCTIHPSFYPEGMSNVLLESAASSRPIITTNRAGCREIVEDGVNGYIVKQQDSKDLINKIELFLKLDYSEKEMMGKCGRRKIKKDFDRKVVVKAYLEEIMYIL